MKSIPLILIVIFTLSTANADEQTNQNAGTPLTAEQTEALIERAMEESAAENDDCSDKKLTACMGITRANCETLRDATLRECTMPLAREILSSNGELTDNIELEHTKCTLELGESRFSIEPEKYVSCMPAGTYQNPEKINEWLKNR